MLDCRLHHHRHHNSNHDCCSVVYIFISTYKLLLFKGDVRPRTYSLLMNRLCVCDEVKAKTNDYNTVTFSHFHISKTLFSQSI